MKKSLSEINLTGQWVGTFTVTHIRNSVMTPRKWALLAAVQRSRTARRR
jgi:hypothetical protein